jgi:two-component system CheB/CheR fusion protein
MFNLRDAPITRKLMVVILSTTALALVLMAGAVATHELLTFRRALAINTQVLAQVVGSMSAGTLAFDSPEEAQESLGAMAAEPQIVAAALYDLDGNLFATFTKAGADRHIPKVPAADGTLFTTNHVMVFRTVHHKGKPQGTIYVQAEQSAIYNRLWAYGGMLIFAGIGAIAGAAAVSSLLQRRISRPIVALAETARAVSAKQDYSVRATRYGRDEIGDLTDAFNQMLTRIGETQEALEQAKNSAEGANRAKDEFLAILSHELRTPLSPVLATLAVLEEDSATPPTLQRELEMIRRNVEVEARLIDDLLDVTRISRGKLELHTATVDLRDLLQHAVDNYLLKPAGQKQLAVKLELADGAETWIHADASRITQVLWNLLQNAVKFTPAEGSIHIRLYNPPVPQGTQHEVVIEIIDTGIGIDAELLPRIFDAFEQGERSRTRLFGGLGLGLAISRAIVQLHGGALTAASTGKNAGSTFTVRLPTVPRPAPEIKPQRPRDGGRISPAHSGGASRILLVEDHPDTAQQLARLLSRVGHQVTCAGSIAEARARAAEAPFDLVLSDLGLPDGSGHDLMRELSNLYGLRGIALSGYGMEEDVRESLTAGFSRHLTKPVNWSELKAAISGITGETGGEGGTRL